VIRAVSAWRRVRPRQKQSPSVVCRSARHPPTSAKCGRVSPSTWRLLPSRGPTSAGPLSVPVGGSFRLFPLKVPRSPPPAQPDSLFNIFHRFLMGDGRIFNFSVRQFDADDVGLPAVLVIFPIQSWYMIPRVRPRLCLMSSPNSSRRVMIFRMLRSLHPHSAARVS